MVGNSAASCTRYWARAFSMFSAATRRSRLLASAVSITRCKAGSVNTSRQPISATGAAAAAAVSPAKVWGTGAMGRW
jgi:hypothetical protein